MIGMISGIKDYAIIGLAVALVVAGVGSVVMRAKLGAARSELQLSQFREVRLQEEVAKSTALLDEQRRQMNLQNEVIKKTAILGERADAAQRLVDEYALRSLDREREIRRLEEESREFALFVESKTVCETYEWALRDIAGEELSDG